MTSPQLTADEELRKRIAALLTAFKQFHYSEAYFNKTLDGIEAAIISWADKRQLDPFNFVEPCEPECSEVRHARHAGQWEMAVRMEAAIKSRIEKERG